ncbi:MAG: hypothetical protein AB1810_05575 [Pseudomonadota bacterium]
MIRQFSRGRPRAGMSVIPVVLRSLLLAFVALVQPAAMAAASEKARVDAALLQAEFDLAKSGATYSIIDLAQNKIIIKAAGVVLRQLPIVEVDIWGRRPAPRSYRVSEKVAAKEPERIQIEPGKEESVHDIDALERNDMPVRYTIVFDDGIKVGFSGAAGTHDRTMAEVAHDTWALLVRPLVFLWKHWQDEKHSVIDIKLDPVDSQSFYWSVPENSATIFIFPE